MSLLPMKRLVRTVLGEKDLDQQVRSRAFEVDRMRRRRSLLDCTQVREVVPPPQLRAAQNSRPTTLASPPVTTPDEQNERFSTKRLRHAVLTPLTIATLLALGLAAAPHAQAARGFPDRRRCRNRTHFHTQERGNRPHHGHPRQGRRPPACLLTAATRSCARRRHLNSEQGRFDFSSWRKIFAASPAPRHSKGR